MQYLVDCSLYILARKQLASEYLTVSSRTDLIEIDEWITVFISSLVSAIEYHDVEYTTFLCWLVVLDELTDHQRSEEITVADQSRND